MRRGKSTIKRGKSGYIVGFPRGKCYYIASFPGKGYFIASFPGGGIWLGGKATIQYRFFKTTVHQRIIFMFLVKTRLYKNSVKISDSSSQYLWRKSEKKIRYLNYERTVNVSVVQTKANRTSNEFLRYSEQVYHWVNSHHIRPLAGCSTPCPYNKPYVSIPLQCMFNIHFSINCAAVIKPKRMQMCRQVS